MVSENEIEISYLNKRDPLYLECTFSQYDSSLLPCAANSGTWIRGIIVARASGKESTGCQSYPTTNIPSAISDSQVSLGGSFTIKFSSKSSSSEPSSAAFLWFMLRITAIAAAILMHDSVLLPHIQNAPLVRNRCAKKNHRYNQVRTQVSCDSCHRFILFSDHNHVVLNWSHDTSPVVNFPAARGFQFCKYRSAGRLPTVCEERTDCPVVKSSTGHGESRLGIDDDNHRCKLRFTCNSLDPAMDMP
jgi:hypothetical protein